MTQLKCANESSISHSHLHHHIVLVCQKVYAAMIAATDIEPDEFISHAKAFEEQFIVVLRIAMD